VGWGCAKIPLLSDFLRKKKWKIGNFLREKKREYCEIIFHFEFNFKRISHPRKNVVWNGVFWWENFHYFVIFEKKTVRQCFFSVSCIISENLLNIKIGGKKKKH
jgi:hypothetical protein